MLQLENYIRSVADFPKPGILFRDISPLLLDPKAFSAACEVLSRHCQAMQIDRVVAIESRGFIFGSAIARELGLPFVPVRKPGKLPHEVHSVQYTLEYGQGALEIHRDAISAGDRVAIVDDLLATGGTAAAAASLVEKCGAEVAGFIFLIELQSLHGRSRLKGCNVHALIQYE